MPAINSTAAVYSRGRVEFMVTLRAREAMGTGQEVLGKVPGMNLPGAGPARTLHSLHCCRCSLAGISAYSRRLGRFSSRVEHTGPRSRGGGGGGARPSPLCSTQWDAYGLLQSSSCHPICTGCRWRAHEPVCQDPASVRRGYAGWPRGRRHQSGVAVSATAQEWWV